MKLLLSICLVLCAAGTLCSAASEAERHACAEENKVDPNSLDDLAKLKDPSQDVKCFAACILKKDGQLNEDGTLSQKFKDGPVTKSCTDTEGTDACETAGKIIKCLKDFSELADD